MTALDRLKHELFRQLRLAEIHEAPLERVKRELFYLLEEADNEISRRQLTTAPESRQIPGVWDSVDCL